MVRTCLMASLSFCLVTASASAADGDASAGETLVTNTASVAFVARSADRPTAVVRGPMLPLLYGTLAGLQAYDGWSTVRAARLGATEANPVVAGLSSNPGAMWAMKVGATMVSVYAAEHLWRQHRRTQAIVTMVAVNGLMAVVAAHNGSAMRGLQ